MLKFHVKLGKRLDDDEVESINVDMPDDYSFHNDFPKFPILKQRIYENMKSKVGESNCNKYRPDMTDVLRARLIEYEDENSSIIKYDNRREEGQKKIRQEEILPEVSSRIYALAAALPALDESRKSQLIMLLHQFIVNKYDKINWLNSQQNYALNTEIYDLYDESMKESIKYLVCGTNCLMYHYGSSAYRHYWDELWSGGHIKMILECEGFM